MARIRTIKPDFWTDALMVQLPYFVRLFYISLWNAADDHGFLPSEIDRLAMELMPREKLSEVDKAFQLLEACERIELFVSDCGNTCYRIAKWSSHQKVDRPSKSKILRETSRKLAIPQSVRRDIAKKYGCQPGKQKKVDCYYCGLQGEVYWFAFPDGRPSSWVTFPGLEIEHLIAESEGGETQSENLVLACRNCNRSKGTKHWVDFMLSRAFANNREASRKNPLDQGRDQGKDHSLCDPPQSAESLKSEFNFVTSGSGTWNLPKEKLDEWSSTFTGIDVGSQLRTAAQWLKDNPTNRKTDRGMIKFLGGWLTRAQNNPRPPLQPGKPIKRESDLPVIDANWEPA